MASFDQLANIGLSKYESKVYVTLIEEGITTAKNISNVTGIPYGKVYEIINLLSLKGFVIIMPSKPMKYRAIGPEQAFEHAKKEINEKYSGIEEQIISSLEPMYIQTKMSKESKRDFVIINGRSNVVNKTEMLLSSAQKNINIQCSANSFSRLMSFKNALKQAHARGVKICIGVNGLQENVLDFCDVRAVKSANNNFLSVDGRECLVINANPDDKNEIYGRDLGINAISVSFTRFLDNFFEENFA